MGAATQAAFLLFSEAPALLLAPFCGAIVDTLPRARVAAAADVLAALGALVVLVLMRAGSLGAPVLLAAAAWASACNAMHWPAFVLLLRDLESTKSVPPESDGQPPGQARPKISEGGISAAAEQKTGAAAQLSSTEPTADTSTSAAKRTGMAEAAPALSMLIAPLLSAYMTQAYGLDAAFYWVFGTCALSTLLLMLHPQLMPSATNPAESAMAAVSGASSMSVVSRTLRRLIADGAEAAQLLWQRRPLRNLFGLTVAGFLASGVVQVMMVPLVLATAPAVTLGWVLTLSGTGSIVGAALLWGTGLPKSVPPHVSLLAIFAGQGMLLILCGALPHPTVTWSVAFSYMLFLPALRGARQVLLERLAPAHALGRLLAIQRALLQACLPLAAMLAAPLSLALQSPLQTVPFFAAMPAPAASALFMLAGVGCVATALAYGFTGALSDTTTRRHKKAE